MGTPGPSIPKRSTSLLHSTYLLRFPPSVPRLTPAFSVYDFCLSLSVRSVLGAQGFWKTPVTHANGTCKDESHPACIQRHEHISSYGPLKCSSSCAVALLCRPRPTRATQHVRSVTTPCFQLPHSALFTTTVAQTIKLPPTRATRPVHYVIRATYPVVASWNPPLVHCGSTTLTFLLAGLSALAGRL